MLAKQCLKKGICGKVYKEGEDGFELSYCKLCGAPLEEIDLQGDSNHEGEKKADGVNSNIPSKREGSKILVDRYGYIHFSEAEQENFLRGVKFIAYKDKLVHKIIKMTSNKVILKGKMLDLSSGKDEENILIYKEKDGYFIQNLSENKLFLDHDEIPHNESIKVNDGQIIVLNANNWIEFKMN